MLEGGFITLFPVVKLFPPNGGVEMGEAPLKLYIYLSMDPGMNKPESFPV
jgi:hypothetical protein